MPRPPKGERALIEALTRHAGRSRAVRLGIGDDCALLRPPPGSEIAVTTDLFLENVHFRRDWHTPESAGHRCLARGLSDLAAMGARPLAAFLSFALPPELAGAWASRFLRGLLALARAHAVPLAGGDTAGVAAVEGTALFTADIVLVGAVPRGGALLRSAARPGDAIYVTGSLGGAAAELASLPVQRPPRTASPARPHFFPQPRLAQGLRLRSQARAAIDLSDGLSTDLSHLCDSSGLHAELRAARIPLHPLALRAPDPLALALHGGEDYELLFTADPALKIPKSIQGVPVTRIGEMRHGKPGITLVGADGGRASLPNRGWQHLTNSG